MKYSMMMNEMDYSASKRGRKSHEIIARDMDEQSFMQRLRTANKLYFAFQDGSTKLDYVNEIKFSIKMGKDKYRNYIFTMDSSDERGIKVGIDDSFALINFYQFSDGSNVAVFQDLTKECEYIMAENVSNTSSRFASNYQVFTARWKAEEWMEEVKKAKSSL